MVRPLFLGAVVAAALSLAACSKDTPSTETGAGAYPGTPSPGGAPGGLAGSTEQAIAEWQSIAQQVGSVQQRVFQDPEIQAERQSVADLVETVMAEIDTTVPTQISRFQEIEALMKTPEVQADSAAARELLMEAEVIRDSLIQTQNAATARENVAAKAQALQDHVLAKMTEIDPDVSNLMERADSLSNEIRASQAMNYPGPPLPGGAEAEAEDE